MKQLFFVTEFETFILKAKTQPIDFSIWSDIEV